MPTTQKDDRRHEHRYPVYRIVRYVHHGRKRRGLLQNLSQGGVRMLCYGGAHVGQRIWLTLPEFFSDDRVGEPVEGKIVWSRGSATGVEFVDMVVRPQPTQLAPQPRDDAGHGQGRSQGGGGSCAIHAVRRRFA